MQPQQISVIEPWGDVGVYDSRPDLTAADVDKVFTFQDNQTKQIVTTNPRKVALEQLGITQSNTAAQNDRAWDKAVSLGIDHETLLLKKGRYPIGQMYGLGLTLTIEGPGKAVSGFSVPPACLGGHFTRNKEKNYGGLFGGGFSIWAEGQVTDDGILLPGEIEPDFGGDQNQRFLFYALRKRYHGLFLEVVSNLSDFGVYGFSGHQVKLEGFIDGNGTDVSNTMLRRFEASAGNLLTPQGAYPGYGGCGVFIWGLDANNLLLDCPNVNNNPQAGILDASGVGITVRTPHASRNGWGHYHTISPSASTKYDNPYLEGGSPTSTVTPRCAVSNGTRGSAFEGGWNMEGNTLRGEFNAGPMRLDKDGAMTLSGHTNTGSISLLDLSTTAAPLPHYALRRASSDNAVSAMNWVAPNVTIPVFNSPNGSLVAPQVMVALHEPAINGNTPRSTNTFPTFSDVTAMLRPGDPLTNNGGRGRAVPRAWQVAVGGYLNPPDYTEGYVEDVSPAFTASATRPDSNGQYNYVLQLSGATALQPGSFVTIGGKTACIAPFPLNLKAFAHDGPDEFYDQKGGALLTLEDGSLIPGTTKDIRVSQLGVQNVQCTVNQPLPADLKVGTKLRVRYSSDTDVKYITFTGFLDDTTKLAFFEPMPVGSNMAITYAKAEVVPLTAGAGPLSQRPTTAEMLQRPDHVGWPYHATDAPHAYWSGTDWV